MSVSGGKPTSSNIEAILKARSEAHQLLGQIITVLSAVPRYRVHPIADLTHIVIEPLLRGRLSTVKPKLLEEQANSPGGLSGIIIWATVSETVNSKIRTQIEAEVFPTRLIGEEWTSGQHLWFLDVIAPTAELAKTMLLQFRQSTASTTVSIHPHLMRLFDAEFMAALSGHPNTGTPRRVLN